MIQVSPSTFYKWYIDSISESINSYNDTLCVFYINNTDSITIDKIRSKAINELSKFYKLGFKNNLLIKCTKHNIKITDTIFNVVIDTLNRETSKKIIKGETVSYHQELGEIYICKVKRAFVRADSLPVDWGSTNKVKQEIINRGGILYEVLERDELGNITKDNGGEKYIVVYNKEYIFKWFLKPVAKSKITNIRQCYKFEPTNARVQTSLPNSINIENLKDKYINLWEAAGNDENKGFKMAERKRIMNEMYNLNIRNIQKTLLICAVNSNHIENYATLN